MTHEAAGVPPTRNDDDRQDNDRPAEPQAVPETQDAPASPAGDAGETGAPQDAAPRPEARLAKAVQVAEQALIEFEIA
ncbi:hypothetical protein G3M55_01850, partial [Streptomyces sp. SID8455]|nr:hypothetical protein [Streptomyces sp. SID8455]